MAVNPDPKPGRWILPLVILGMVAFTYFFVRELPQASPDTTLLGGPETTTTTTTGTTGTTQNGTDDGVPLDPEVQAYLDAIDEINSELQVLRTSMVTVNSGFDADPREIEFSDAEAALETLAADAQALADRLDALTVPEPLQTNHGLLAATINVAAVSAADALAGLRSSDTGELRLGSVESFTTAADDFDTEVTNAHNAANASA